MESSSTIRARQTYTRLDDRLIIKYFIATKDVDHLGGNECWKRLEKSSQHNPSGRTWQSLKERFRKVIRPSLRRYDLTPEQLELFDAGRSANDRILERKRMQTKSALDTSSDEICDPDDDEPRPVVESREVVPFRVGSAGCSREVAQRSTLDTNAIKGLRQASSPKKDGNPDTKRSETVVKRRSFYHESSPLLPEKELFAESPKRFMRLNDSDSENGSLSPGSFQPSRERNASEKESRKPTGKRRSSEIDPNKRIRRPMAEEESPPDAVDETIVSRNPSPEIVRPRRRVRFQNESFDERDESSPVIETASRSRRQEPRRQDVSAENLEGVMFGALIPTQNDDSIASRTRSSEKATGAIESPVNSPEAPIRVESQKKFSKKTIPVNLSSREIKQESADGFHEVVALRRPDSSTRISTQDMLRNAISDTQSDESFHSAFQSPRNTERQDDGSGSPNKTQKRKNHESLTGTEDEGAAKKTRADQTASETNGAVHSSTARQDLMLPRIGRLRIPEFPEIRDESLIAFVGLIKSTFWKHNTWGPHEHCPGLHEFLYLCKILRERIMRARSGSGGSRERDAVLIDHHLYDMFDVPFCSRDRKNRSIDTRGVHRYLLDSGDWMTLLNDLNLLYEAGELLKNLSARESDGGVEGNS